MAHKHSVYDTDLHFVIDPITRKITTECKKTQLMQKDHNSERFTFEIPRYIEGHDMSLCNVVQIHYINTNSTNKDYQVQDIYEVNDLQVSPDSEDIVIGSWLISSNATTYSGTLNFVIRFACVDEETKAIDYQWFTDIYSAITVAKTIYNVDVVTEGESSDLLEKWKEEISKAADESTLEIVQEAKKSEQAASNSASAAAQSETKAKASATDATSSAQSASDDARAAIESANSAQQSADIASEKAAEASESAESASSSAQSSSTSATSAGDSATAASGSATLAESYAHGGTGTREGEDTDNAKYWAQEAKKSEQAASDSASAASQSENNAGESATNAASSAQSASDSARAAIESSNSAQQSAGTASEKAAEASESAQSASSSASSAVDSATAASASAILAESYTHGRTGTREGEDTDNAKYYMEQTKAVSSVNVATTEKAGIVKPDGTTITADGDGIIRVNADSELSATSTNSVQNKVVKKYVDDRTVVDSAMSDSSTNAVQNKVVKSYVDTRTSSVAWNNITGKPSTYPPSSHTHTKSQIIDFPSSMSANGGNSATVNGHTVNSDVPSGAQFTDTTYNDATTSAHGLMTPAMVSKLNGIADGANKTTVDAAMSDSSTNSVQNKVVKSYVDNGLNTLKKSVSDGKTLVANAITDKGVKTATDATFDAMAENISKIETGGGELHGATLAVSTSESVLFGKTVTLTLNGANIGTTVFASNGKCSFIVQNPGTYTITCVDANIDVTVTSDNVLNKTVISVDLSLFKIVTFADGTDAEIAKMIQEHYNNKINIADYWAVGDTRTVHLSAMPATGVGESHREQTVQFAIADFGKDELSTAINGHTMAAATLTQVNCLMDATSASNSTNGSNDTEKGYMNSTDTNAGGWKDCARRKWCNDVYYNALPSVFKSMVKEVNKKTSAGNRSSTINITKDKAFLLSEVEIFGSTVNSKPGEGSQYEYYKTTANRYKLPKWSSSINSHIYWDRSPDNNISKFCCIYYGGDGHGIDNASRTYGFAPCLCI